MLTVSQVADSLQLSRITIYGLIKSGKLKAYRVGLRQYRVFEEDLKAFVRAEDLNNDN